MSALRPELTPDELRDARDAWMLVLLGQPIPAQYRAGAAKAARYAFGRGYDHDDAAGPRPVFLHPDGGDEGVPGVYGVNRTWSPSRLAGWIVAGAAGVREKGTGPMYSPGHSWRGDDHDAQGETIAGAYPLPPLQRGDDRCRSLGWVFLDADASGDWTALSDALGAQGAAFVRSRSSGHCPGGCPAHPEGATKWHLALPLRETWVPSGALNVDRARWKSELYAAARFALHLVGELSGRGFDRELAQFLCRMYVGAPRDRDHAAVPREVLGREGLGFDVAACLGALEELGVVDPADVRAARTAAQFAPGRAWDLDDGTPPMVAAFLVAGLYGRQLTNGNHTVVCPWESLHSGGEPLDSSTVLFPNGKFHCSHSHAEGKAADGVGMREVVAMLPPEAQAAHEEARRQGRAKLATVPSWAIDALDARPSAAPPCVDADAERDVLRALVRDDIDAPAAKPGDPPRAWQRVAAVLADRDFADPAHGAVFAAMARAKAAGKPLAAAVLRDELRAARALPHVIAAAAALAGEAGEVLAGASLDATALVVADLAARRRLGRALGESARALIAGRPLVETHGELLRKVREVRLPGVRLPTMREEMEAAGKRMDARRAGDVDRVLRSSVRDLNDALEGGYRTGLTLIGARPFIGKTVLTTQEVVFTAAHVGPVLYVSYESRRAEIVDGMISFLSGVPLDKVRAPATQDQAEYDAVDAAMAALERLPITIVDRATAGAPDTVPQIEAAMLALPKPVVMVAIDHIRKLKPAGKHSEVRHALGEISEELHELTKNYGIAVLALIHVGRAAVKGQLARVPTIEDFKESGDLEDNTDTAVILHNEGRYPTKKYPEGETPSRDLVEVYVPKVRGGRGGGFARLRLRGDVQRFCSTLSQSEDFDAAPPEADDFAPRQSMTRARPVAAPRAPGVVPAADALDAYDPAGGGLPGADGPPPTALEWAARERDDGPQDAAQEVA